RVKKNVTIKVSIPAGSDEGQQIRIAGKGEPGVNAGPAGDLFVVVHIQSHEMYVREGDNIFLELPISFTQAALGNEVEAPTVHGHVTVKIPAGNQNGKVFRLKGKVAPNVRGYGQGDQHIQIRVITPKKLTDRQEELVKGFHEISSDDDLS